MSDVVKPTRLKLWREGFSLFRRHWKEWSHWAVWFFVITALLQAIIVIYMSDAAFIDMMRTLNDAHDAQRNLTPEEYASIAPTAVQFIGRIALLMFVFLMQNFAYKVFFMKQQPGIGLPKMSFGRFFYMLWVDIQITFIIGLIGVALIGVPVGAGITLAHNSPFVIPVAVIVGLIGIGLVFFISYRLVLAPVLAICAVKPTLKTSWRLMKGNCWRMFGNAILLVLVMLLFGILLILLEVVIGIGMSAGFHALFVQIAPNVPVSTQSFFGRYFDPTPGTIDQQIKQYIQIVRDSLNMCIMTGIIWAFHCATVRVLYEEKRADDPAFTLVASS